MKKLDNLVLQALADKVAHPDRHKVILKELKSQINSAKLNQNGNLLILQNEMSELNQTAPSYN